MRIFMVTDGSYSDYHVLGLYSNEALAREAKELFNADNEVSEFELDAMPEHPPGMLPWEVAMDRDGNVRYPVDYPVDRKVADAKPRRIGFMEGLRDWRPYGDITSFDSRMNMSKRSSGLVVFEMWARDPEHAIKIANERRTRLIATNEWTTDWKEWCERDRKGRAAV